MTRVLLSVLLVATAVLLANAQAVDFSTHSQNASTLHGNWIANSTTSRDAFFSPSTTPDGTTPVAAGFTFKAQNNNNDVYQGAALSVNGASSNGHANMTFSVGNNPVMKVTPTQVEIFTSFRIIGNLTVINRTDIGIRPTIDLWQRASIQIGGATGNIWILGSQYTPACGTTCAISDQKLKRNVRRVDACSYSASAAKGLLGRLGSPRRSQFNETASSCTSFDQNSTIARMRDTGRYDFKYIQGLTPCDDCEHTGWMAQKMQKNFPEVVSIEDFMYQDTNTHTIVSRAGIHQIDSAKIIPHLWDGLLDVDQSIEAIVRATSDAIQTKQQEISTLSAALAQTDSAMESLTQRVSALRSKYGL